MKIRLEKWQLTAGFFFLLFDVYGGVFRYYLALWGLPSLVLLPKFLLIIVIVAELLLSSLRGTINLFWMLVLVITSFLIFIGLLFLPFFQVVLGLWILVPFFYGISVWSNLLTHWNRLCFCLFFLWGSAVIGVLLNLVYTWPWMGFHYAFQGFDIEGSRLWTTSGYLRLPGFSRASFAVANQLLLLGLTLFFLLTGWKKIALWLISGTVILLTTTKTALGIWLSLTFLLMLQYLPSACLLPTFWRIIPILLTFIVIGGPLYSICSHVSLIESPLLHSLTDRLNWMWPMTFQMIIKHGNWLFGRGIGGIGTAQRAFNSSLYCPADNFALYLFGLGGILGVGLLLIYGLAPFYRRQSMLQDRFFFLLTISVLMEGLTVNVMESPMFAIALGLTARYWWWRHYHPDCYNLYA